MPEIGEVHRIVQYCRKHLVNRTIAKVHANEDPIIYLEKKTGLTAKKLDAALTGKTIVGAKQQGKYFWLELDKPPHLLMHLGMTGWVKFSHDDSAGYKPQREKNAEEKRKKLKQENGDEDEPESLEADPTDAWPPRFCKFSLDMAGSPKFSAAFVDPRRLGRVRLIDAPADKMRQTAPLSENGPDPVIDKHIFTAAWLGQKLKSKKVPVKALLLDQANISGIGNWVADEALYQARVHPEQYSNTLNEAQVGALHASIVDVCTTACDTLADSSKFPDHWLMRYRWSKGKKGENTLPSGDKITWITVGGRTSAVVPAVQKKTGPVAADVEDAGDEDDEEVDVKPAKKPAGKKSNGAQSKTSAPAPTSRGKRKAEQPEKSEVKEEEKDKSTQSTTKKAKTASKPSTAAVEANSGRRRSSRNK